MFVAMMKYLYAPVLFLSFLAVALALVVAGAPKWWLAVLLLIAIALSFVAERIAPNEPAWNSDKRDGSITLRQRPTAT